MATTNNYYKIKHGLEAPSQDAIQVTESTRPTIRPTLNLNFAQAKVLDPRITFARASTATYYDGKTVAKAEENLVLQSQTFDSYPTWVPGFATITANVTTAPDGTMTADKLVEDSTTASHYVLQGVTLSAGVYVFSFFAKADGRSWVHTRALFGQTYFDVTNGVLGTVPAGVTATITNFGNGWYRCTASGAITAGANTAQIACGSADNTDSTLGDGVSGVFLWGAQLEQRSSVTAYTPTTTQPITNYIPVLQTTPSGVARFDHNPVTGESLGLEIEEQRTNLLTYSSQFDDASWNKNNATVTANTVVAPDGTLTADTITTTGSNSYATKGGFSVANSTLSLYVKQGFGTFFTLFTDGNSSNDGVKYNLSTGVIVTLGSNNVSASITSVGNGWYRLVATRGATAGTAIYIGFLESGASINDYHYIWGAQLEVGAKETSYIPTVASQVTRAADNASMTGTNLFSWFNPSQGTLYAEAYHLVSVNQQAYFAQIAGTGAGTQYGASIAVGKFGANSIDSGQRIKGIVFDNNDPIANLVTASDVTTFPVKVSVSYKVNDFAASINGATTLTDTSGILPVIGTDGVFTIGALRGGGLYANSTIKKITYYPARLTNAELQSLTS